MRPPAPTREWFGVCEQLVRARFHPASFALQGELPVAELRVTRVHRVQSRHLQLRFQERVLELLDQGAPGAGSHALEPYLPNDRSALPIVFASAL